MSIDIKSKVSKMWDKKFSIASEVSSDENGYMYGTKPNEFLKEQLESYPSKQKILFLGEGEGRNACYAASLHHEVTALDASEVGLTKAQLLAKKMGVTIETLLVDLEEYTFPKNRYDIIMTSFMHLMEPLRSEAFKGALTALKSSGVLIAEFFTQKQISRNSGGPKMLELLYTKEAMQDIFSDENIIMIDECVVTLNEGSHHCGEADVLRIIIQKK